MKKKIDTETVINPKLIFFWNLLAYPKLLVKFGFFTLLILIYTAYIISRPEIFIENNSTITGIKFHKATINGELDSINIEYQYTYKNKIYESDGFHYLPRGYPQDKVSEYVSTWSQKHNAGSSMKILVNVWLPQYSGFEMKTLGWFFGFIIYYLLFYWLPLMLILILTSMIIKYFFMKPCNDE